MSPGPTSPFFTIAPTPYGGRGAFASQHIPKDTLILSCEAPYASVICRKFRKEVCAWCFSWSWEAMGKSNWTLTVPLEPQPVEVGKAGGGGGQKRNGMVGPNAGVVFCGEECRNSWLADGENCERETCHAGIRGVVNAALERCLTSMGKDKTKTRAISPPSEFEFAWMGFLQTLEDLSDGSNLSSTFLEDTWDRAGRLASFSRTSTPVEKEIASLSKKIKSKIEHISPTMLSEIELDTARFVLAGLVKKCIESEAKVSDLIHRERYPPNTSYPAGTWSDVLDLQDNTLPHVQLKPHILASHIRVWAFIKFVIYLASKDTKGLSEQTKRLMQSLKQSVDTPADTRAILGREHGNVFGIWDLAPEGVDSEMLGWGLYSFGSYFNHDCSPSLHKKAKGRAIEYYTLRDVSAGEELCISYVEEKDEVMKRRDALKEWFFECACGKCQTELQL